MRILNYILAGTFFLSACATEPVSFDREPIGSTEQEQITSVAGLDYRNAKEIAERRNFDASRDAGFAAVSVLNGGVGGIIGGGAALLSSPTMKRELVPHLFAELPNGAETRDVEVRISEAAASFIGRPSNQMGVQLTRYGQVGGKTIFGVAIFGKETMWDNHSVEAANVYKKMVDQMPSLLSAYVPPLKTAGTWSGPYFYQDGKVKKF